MKGFLDLVCGILLLDKCGGKNFKIMELIDFFGIFVFVVYFKIMFLFYYMI